MNGSNSPDIDIPVTAPSGATYFVMSADEKDYFEDRASRYLADNHFVNITDLQDLDRLIMMELMMWRWGIWLSTERDYEGQSIDPDTTQKTLNEASKEVRAIKKQLGIDKATREKDKGESVSEYIENLRRRAKEFGVMREQQAVKAITLFQELQALIALHQNCDEVERREQNIEMHDILDWLTNIAFPEFNEIDAHFKKNKQRYWIREQ